MNKGIFYKYYISQQNFNNYLEKIYIYVLALVFLQIK